MVSGVIHKRPFSWASLVALNFFKYSSLCCCWAGLSRARKCLCAGLAVGGGVNSLPSGASSRGAAGPSTLRRWPPAVQAAPHILGSCLKRSSACTQVFGVVGGAGYFSKSSWKVPLYRRTSIYVLWENLQVLFTEWIHACVVHRKPRMLSC